MRQIVGKTALGSSFGFSQTYLRTNAILGTDLNNSTGIASYRFVSQEEALQEFNEDYFPDNPEITQLVTTDVIPSSYRVIPAQLNAGYRDSCRRV